MSFDLGVWVGAGPITADEAFRRYAAWSDGDAVPGEPSPETAAFYDELTSVFPDLTAENYGTSPWSEPLTVSEDFVLMNAVFPRAGEVCRAVLELARRHPLVLFDPEP
ncbi:hypothetical protein FHS43_002455 [Streptosporangium becharense]|uniref:Uncharacterized protein n=1 Tax=Streptosporangium becharense TaxID=1816182 RepID=A0A7W9IJA4_9ACTN|nr:hypothetical protein [Streptosporangium becharense]MBB2911190.1 hypothetical protein [Streptosporangium becharense]MBB5821752.1 hypothetical protein [Streptosporangium becharense]